jgi:hypothetical protein
MLNQTDPKPIEPKVKAEPGDLLTAEAWDQMQVEILKEVAANKAADDKAVADLEDKIKNVDAPKFGGMDPDGWYTNLDKRYLRRDDLQVAGEYRRYFKQVDENIDTTPEPIVIQHNLCRYPVVEVYELLPLFDTSTELKIKGYKPVTNGDYSEWPFDPTKVKFLLFYAANRDPIAEMLSTEAGERVYWGDPLQTILDTFKVQPALTQKLDDLVNDLWGKMFNTNEEDDDFRGESYGQSQYVQKWMDDDKSVEDLTKGGQYGDLRMAIRPALLSPGFQPASPNSTDTHGAPNDVKVFHLSLNAVEIQVRAKMDLMVILRS